MSYGSYLYFGDLPRLERGIAHYEKKAYSKALKLLLPLAEKGYARAQLYVGDCYANGNGVVMDTEGAVKWYRAAADQELPEAQHRMCRCCFDGVGIERNVENAAKWCRKAADAGFVEAMFDMGTLYDEGLGVEQDAKSVFKWHRKGAEQEYPPSLYQFGLCYKLGIGTNKDEDEASKWQNKAVSAWRANANAGDTEAMIRLGGLYMNGDVVELDKEKAVEWYRKAAEAGSAFGQSALAVCYLNGEGVDADHEEAAEWMLKSAEQGVDRESQWAMGCFYYDGVGVAKDVKEAVKWLDRSVKKGLPKAKYSLALCYLRGDGVEKDTAKAKKLLEEASDAGVEDAKKELDRINGDLVKSSASNVDKRKDDTSEQNVTVVARQGGNVDVPTFKKMKNYFENGDKYGEKQTELLTKIVEELAKADENKGLTKEQLREKGEQERRRQFVLGLRPEDIKNIFKYDENGKERTDLNEIMAARDKAFKKEGIEVQTNQRFKLELKKMFEDFVAQNQNKSLEANAVAFARRNGMKVNDVAEIIGYETKFEDMTEEPQKLYAKTKAYGASKGPSGGMSTVSQDNDEDDDDDDDGENEAAAAAADDDDDDDHDIAASSANVQDVIIKICGGKRLTGKEWKRRLRKEFGVGKATAKLEDELKRAGYWALRIESPGLAIHVGRLTDSVDGFIREGLRGGFTYPSWLPEEDAEYIFKAYRNLEKKEAEFQKQIQSIDTAFKGSKFYITPEEEERIEQAARLKYAEPLFSSICFDSSRYMFCQKRLRRSIISAQITDRRWSQLKEAQSKQDWLKMINIIRSAAKDDDSLTPFDKFPDKESIANAYRAILNYKWIVKVVLKETGVSSPRTPYGSVKSRDEYNKLKKALGTISDERVPYPIDIRARAALVNRNGVIKDIMHHVNEFLKDSTFEFSIGEGEVCILFIDDEWYWVQAFSDPLRKKMIQYVKALQAYLSDVVTLLTEAKQGQYDKVETAKLRKELEARHEKLLFSAIEQFMGTAVTLPPLPMQIPEDLDDSMQKRPRHRPRSTRLTDYRTDYEKDISEYQLSQIRKNRFEEYEEDEKKKKWQPSFWGEQLLEAKQKSKISITGKPQKKLSITGKPRPKLSLTEK